MYSFGQTLSLPFYTETWRPDSWYPRLEENLRLGVHTLVLLDIKVREQSEENMARCVIFFYICKVWWWERADVWCGVL